MIHEKRRECRAGATAVQKSEQERERRKRIKRGARCYVSTNTGMGAFFLICLSLLFFCQLLPWDGTGRPLSDFEIGCRAVDLTTSLSPFAMMKKLFGKTKKLIPIPSRNPGSGHIPSIVAVRLRAKIKLSNW